jgi:hypothetical protein
MAAVPLERDEEKLAAIPVGMTGRLWVLSLWFQMTPLRGVSDKHQAGRIGVCLE